MSVELAIVVTAVAVLFVALLDLLDGGRTAERRTALCRVGGAVVVVSLGFMGADWLAEHTLRSVEGAAFGSGWIGASAAVLEQLLRLVIGAAA